MQRFRECCFRTLPTQGRRLVWEVTHNCSMGCDYCFQERKRLKNPIRVLNESDLKKLCSRLSAIQVADVLLTGGEIRNSQDMMPLICRELQSAGLPFSFSTVTLDSDFVSMLLSYRPRSLNLSLDPRESNGQDQADENYLRATERVVALAQERGVNVKITGVIHRANIDNVGQYIHDVSRLIDKFSVVTSVYVTNPYDIGFSKLGLRPSEKKLQRMLDALRIDKCHSAIQLVNYYRFHAPLQACLAGSRYVHLEPNGDVYPCHLFANLPSEYYRMGNILLDDAAHIEENLKSFGKQVQEASKDYKKQHETCASCGVATECGAGCMAEIISLGNLIEPQLVCKYIAPPKVPKRFIPSAQPELEFPRPKADLAQDEEGKIISHVKATIRKGRHDLAHGFDHIQCVVRLARLIAQKEGADLRVVTAAAYFHDAAPRRRLIFESHTELSAQHAVTFLKSIGFGEEELNRVYHCINTSSYGAHELGYEANTLEARVVRDADWLDAIGARGIARVFAFGAAHGCETLGECVWYPRNPPKKQMSLVGPDPSPIYHFFSKLLWVKDRLSTTTGKAIGAKRHERLVEFLANYQEEMAIPEFPSGRGDPGDGENGAGEPS